MSKLPDEILDDYPNGTACIRCEVGGKIKDWFISAHPKNDNEETLRHHLLKCIPTAKFIGWAIK